ncbi:hypothetical protein BC567DRAFT_239496 [Phyllosticta citribraziliensis]
MVGTASLDVEGFPSALYISPWPRSPHLRVSPKLAQTRSKTAGSHHRGARCDRSDQVETCEASQEEPTAACYPSQRPASKPQSAPHPSSCATLPQPSARPKSSHARAVSPQQLSAVPSF